MLPIIVVCFLFALTMGGLAMVLLSKKLWSRARMPFRERLEPVSVAGFLCMFSGIGLSCFLFSFIF